MTRPIHSLKHIKSAYRKIQILVFICISITIITVILAAISSFRIGSLGRRSMAASAREINAAETASTKKLADADKELAALKEKLEESDNTIKSLREKNASLQKKLTAALESTQPQAPPAKQAPEQPMQPDDSSAAPETDATQPGGVTPVPSAPATTDQPAGDTSGSAPSPSIQDTRPAEIPSQPESEPLPQEGGAAPAPETDASSMQN